MDSQVKKASQLIQIGFFIFSISPFLYAATPKVLAFIVTGAGLALLIAGNWQCMGRYGNNQFLRWTIFILLATTVVEILKLTPLYKGAPESLEALSDFKTYLSGESIISLIIFYGYWGEKLTFSRFIFSITDSRRHSQLVALCERFKQEGLNMLLVPPTLFVFGTIGLVFGNYLFLILLALMTIMAIIFTLKAWWVYLQLLLKVQAS